ncbi:hypothetical protein EDD85DRAFT_793351 [Armillaria nabsnona]|nr:hypothetical protein EDD85DRAFT_793351 [Armillaria nabsnona]
MAPSESAAGSKQTGPMTKRIRSDDVTDNEAEATGSSSVEQGSRRKRQRHLSDVENDSGDTRDVNGLSHVVNLVDGSSMEDSEIASVEERCSLGAAINTGGYWTLFVHFDKVHHVEKLKYWAFFGQIGSCALSADIRAKKILYRHDELRLLVKDEDMHGAMQAIVSLSMAGKGYMY